MAKQRKRHRPASIYRRWHRFLALGGAVFIIFLVLTGTAINHSGQLALGQRWIERPWLLSWYGLHQPEQLESAAVAGKILTWAGQHLYLDGRQVATTHGVAGIAVANEDLLIVADGKSLLLFTHAGELIERLQPEALEGSGIDALGLTETGLVILRSGPLWLQADPDLLGWNPLKEPLTGVRWPTSTGTPEAIGQQVMQHYQGPGLSLEKLLLDLHSGRFFGNLGMIVYDLLALVVLALAVSGLILWQRGRRNGRKNQ